MKILNDILISFVSNGILQFFFFKWNYKLVFNEKTALHEAVEKENLDILVQLLISRQDIDINAKLVLNFVSLISFKSFIF